MPTTRNVLILLFPDVELPGRQSVVLFMVAYLRTPAAITKERGKRDDDPRRSPPVCGRVGGVERP
jgi:hypothetical protein